jgi:hypothetical protein
MEHKKLTESINMSASLRARLRNKDGKELLDIKINGPVEIRFTKRAGKAMQIVYKDGDIVHLHCKDSNCGNEWKVKDSSDWTSKFEIKETDIKCLKCGKVYKSG